MPKRLQPPQHLKLRTQNIITQHLNRINTHTRFVGGRDLRPLYFRIIRNADASFFVRYFSIGVFWLWSKKIQTVQ